MSTDVVNNIQCDPRVRSASAAPGQPRTVAQAAIEMNVAKSTVRAWLAQRRLGYVRLGRSIRVPEAEITRFIEEGSTPPAPRR